MVYLHFPPQLTEEEEMLQKKYQKLRKKKKALQMLKAPKVEQIPIQGQFKQSAEAKQDAIEHAKKLIKSGAIAGIKIENKERQGFKRPKALERRRSATDKGAGGVTTLAGYRPFGSSQGDGNNSDDNSSSTSTSTSRPAYKHLYDSFHSGGSLDEDSKSEEHVGGRDRDARFDRPRQGNTIYVRGLGVSEEVLQAGFAHYGGIINVSMEMDKNCGFITFDKVESAEKAIKEMNGVTVSNIQLSVSLARHQPVVPSSENSSASWSTIAANPSQKGAHKDKRALVVYDDNPF